MGFWFRLLGGSGVVISRFISPLIWVISIVTLPITLLISTHEPPSRLGSLGEVGSVTVVCTWMVAAYPITTSAASSLAVGPYQI